MFNLSIAFVQMHQNLWRPPKIFGYWKMFSIFNLSNTHIHPFLIVLMCVPRTDVIRDSLWSTKLTLHCMQRWWGWTTQNFQADLLQSTTKMQIILHTMHNFMFMLHFFHFHEAVKPAVTSHTNTSLLVTATLYGTKHLIAVAICIGWIFNHVIGANLM